MTKDEEKANVRANRIRMARHCHFCNHLSWMPNENPFLVLGKIDTWHHPKCRLAL